MKKFKKIMGTGILSMMLACLVLTGCGKKPSIEISAENNVYEVTPGGSLQFNASVKDLNKDEIVYSVDTEDAQITNSGLLTVDTDITVPSTITVVAKIGDVSSNSVTVNVVDLKPESIALVASHSKLSKNGEVTFNVTYNPTYATIKDYTLSIAGGTGVDYVDFVDGELTIKSTATNEQVDGKTVEVKATLTADTTITNTTTITLVDAGKVEKLVAQNAFIKYSDTTKKIEVDGYNGADEDATVYNDLLEFSSSDEDIALIDAETGVLTPKGHGVTTITVGYAGITTTCQVYVMVPATAFALENVSEVIEAGNLYYSKADPLALDFSFENPNFTSCTNAVKYEFALLDEHGDTVATGDDVATVGDNGITFKRTGDVEVTITTNTSLGGRAYKDAANPEKSVLLTVHVNDGININSISEFKAYSEQDDNAVANILCNLNITATDNFGVAENGLHDSLEFRGDRYIYGNGYMLSLMDMPIATEASDECTLFHFDYRDREDNSFTAGDHFTVEIHDFELLGNGGYDAVATGNMNTGTSLMAGTNYAKTYGRAIHINAGSYEEANGVIKEAKTMTYGYVTLNNVKISGFEVGVRMNHIVSDTSYKSLLNNLDIENTFSNGLELDQCQVELRNFRCGKVGAFAIEATPEGAEGTTTSNPTGTSGKGFNETAVLNITGTYNVSNKTNGLDTIYLQGLEHKLGMDINTAISAISAGTIQAILAEIPEGLRATIGAKLNEVAIEMLKDDEDMVNLFLLIFIDKGTDGRFATYNNGNKNYNFLNYTFDNSRGNMISFTEALINVATAAAQGQTYDDYKDYKLIQFDLDTGAGMMGNIGQAILTNEAYEG